MRLYALVLVLAIGVTGQTTGKNQFKPNGDPFHNFEKATPFDSACTSITGTAGSKGSSAQDTVKNNFSAQEPPKNITINDLQTLQTEIAKNPDYPNWKSGKEPVSRDAFHKMSDGFQEGQMVQLTAYVFEAHTADVDSGETVNCGMGSDAQKAKNPVSASVAQTSNDIHIALASASGGTDECKTVTAEVSPHFRPAGWSTSLFSTKLKGKLVRLTGQLMYDSSHKPCTPSQQQAPKRLAAWEIHPVYQVEICTKDDGKGNCTTFETVSQSSGNPQGKGQKTGKTPNKKKKPSSSS